MKIQIISKLNSIIKILLISLSFMVLIECSEDSGSRPPANKSRNKKGLKLSDNKKICNNNITFEKDLKTEIQELIDSKFKDSKLKDIIIGDLNADGVQDILAISIRPCIKVECKDSSESEFRKVLFYINNGHGQYILATYSDYAIDCSTCGGGGVGDPQRSIDVNNGLITFESFYGDCDKTTIYKIFEYNSKKSNWYLKEIRSESYNCNQEPIQGEIKINKSTETTVDFGIIPFSDSRY